MEDFVNAEVFAELATLKFTTDREPDDKEGDSGNNLLPRGRTRRNDAPRRQCAIQEHTHSDK
jgi:hypothetical protein